MENSTGRFTVSKLHMWDLFIRSSPQNKDLLKQVKATKRHSPSRLKAFERSVDYVNNHFFGVKGGEAVIRALRTTGPTLNANINIWESYIMTLIKMMENYLEHLPVDAGRRVWFDDTLPSPAFYIDDTAVDWALRVAREEKARQAQFAEYKKVASVRSAPETFVDAKSRESMVVKLPWKPATGCGVQEEVVEVGVRAAAEAMRRRRNFQALLEVAQVALDMLN